MRLVSPSSLSEQMLGLLEALKCGGFLLDLDGRVLFLNVLARGYLADGLALSGNQLSAKDRAADQRLQRAIGAALNLQKAATVAVPRPARLPLVIQPLALRHEMTQPSEPFGILVLAFDPELWPAPSSAILSQAFGLTNTEAEVAMAVSSGLTLSEIAFNRRVKIGTIRAHLKTIFSKTQTRGQADLTRVLTRIAFLEPQSSRSAMQGVIIDQPIDQVLG